MSAYVTSSTLESRQAQCARLLEAHPGDVPVVLEPANGRVFFVTVPRDSTVAELATAARKTSELVAGLVHMTVNGHVPATSTRIGDLHDLCKQADGFLYVSFHGEPIMGRTYNVPCGNPDNYTYS